MNYDEEKFDQNIGGSINTFSFHRSDGRMRKPQRRREYEPGIGDAPGSGAGGRRCDLRQSKSGNRCNL